MNRKDKNKKSSKLRAEFRKNRLPTTRQADLTRRFQQKDFNEDETVSKQQISGKGELTRKRTVMGTTQETDGDLTVQFEVDASNCVAGTVLSVHGLASIVRTDEGRNLRCAVRRILKTLQTDQRNVVATGDRVLVRVESDEEGIIERVEPRHGILSRVSRGRRHVIVANIDRVLIVVAAAEPNLKPNLVDRFLITAEKIGVEPVVCVNKIDLVDPAELMPIVGVWGQLGYRVLLLSATERRGIERLRRIITGRRSVVAGQSGVGKSSLLNAIDPNLLIPVADVSRENQKGRHTTSAATLIPLSIGGYIVDTPGIRQFQLWDVIAKEVPGFMRDLRPYVSHCRYPDCTHTHEDLCAVKDAVADGRIDLRRYESYCQIIEEL